MPFPSLFKRKNDSISFNQDISILYRLDISSFMATNERKQISHLSKVEAADLETLHFELSQRGFSKHRSIQFAHQRSGYVFLPYYLKSEDQRKDLFSQSTTLPINAQVLCDKIDDDLFLYHFLSITELAVIKERFGATSVRHLVSSLLLYALRYSTATRCYWFHLQPNRTFDIIAVESGRLLFCNSFPLRTNDDALYFMLAIYGATNGNLSRDQLLFAGNVQKGDQVYNLFSKYFFNIKVVDNIEDFDLNPPDESYFKNEFLDLISLQKCEL